MWCNIKISYMSRANAYGFVAMLLMHSIFSLSFMLNIIFIAFRLTLSYSNDLRRGLIRKLYYDLRCCHITYAIIFSIIYSTSTYYDYIQRIKQFLSWQTSDLELIWIINILLRIGRKSTHYKDILHCRWLTNPRFEWYIILLKVSQ